MKKECSFNNKSLVQLETYITCIDCKLNSSPFNTDTFVQYSNIKTGTIHSIHIVQCIITVSFFFLPHYRTQRMSSIIILRKVKREHIKAENKNIRTHYCDISCSQWKIDGIQKAIQKENISLLFKSKFIKLFSTYEQ